MFTISIDSLPFPTPSAPMSEEGLRSVAAEQTFLDERDAMQYADTLVSQGYIVRIESLNSDDVIVCKGLVELQSQQSPSRMNAVTELVTQEIRRRRRIA